MADQDCCCVCHKLFRKSDTIEDADIDDKKQRRVCSQICELSFQYSVGVAHGIIFFQVFSKLCENYSHLNSFKLFAALSSCIIDVDKNDFANDVTEDGFSDIDVKPEVYDIGHPHDSTDIKVFFEKGTESERMVKELPVRSASLKHTETSHASQRHTHTVSTTHIENVQPPVRRTRSAGLVSARSTSKKALTTGLTDVENVHQPCLQGTPVQCKFCSDTFPSGDDQALAQHLCRIHTKDLDLACDVCNAVFKEKKLLRRHKKNVHGKNSSPGDVAKSKQFNCKECGKAFSASDYLQEHCRRSHSVFKQKPVDCNICGESFQNKIRLNRHITSQHQPEGHDSEKKGFWCERCNKQYPTKVRLQRHNQFVHSKQVAVDCTICGKSFRNKLLLKHHIQFMHSKQTPGDCKVCRKTYRNAHLLKMHLKVVHKVKVVGESGQEVLLQCIFCTETFLSGANDCITEHLSELHAKEMFPARTLSCDICGAKFKRKVYLSRHKKKIHSLGALVSKKVEHSNKKEKDKKRYPCDKCGKTYTQSALSKHIRIYHSTQEPVNCDLCGKTLINAFHLEQHKRQHVPTKICHVCGADFKTDAGLRGHLAAHKGTKSHVCEVCGVGFVRKTSWQRHIKLHSETVSFHCDTCPKTFTTVYSLNTHMLAKHHRGVFFNNRIKTLEDVGYFVDKEAVNRHLNCQCIVCGECLINGICPTHPADYMLLFKCNFCELVMNHVDDLCQHLKKHNIPLAFTASTRNYSVATEGKRDDSDMDYTCKVCHKSFQRRENLAGHMKQHKEKAFACHICFKKFTYKCNMQNHLRTHSDDKPFQCEVCQKAFKCKQLLNNHKLVHNLNESPFKCHVCGKGLTRKFFLQRHYRQMHPGVRV